MRSRYLLTAFISLILLALFPDYSFAYLGPGAGLGMIGSLVAVIIAAVVIILGLVLYPIRRLLSHRKSKKDKLNTKVSV